nr:hypothetical protein GCM10025732_47350 [Glycomyces mayteni]
MGVDPRHVAAAYFRQLSAHLRSYGEYPADFWVMMGAGLVYQVLVFAFFTLLFANVDTIAGWDYFEMLMLVGFLSLSRSSISLLWNGIWDTGKLVVGGNLDYQLCRPVPVLFQVASGQFGAQGFGNASIAIATIAVGWIGAGISPWGLPVALLLLGCAVVINVSIVTIGNAVNFWAKGRSSTVASAVMKAQEELVRYPLEIYPVAVRASLTFVLPSPSSRWSR